MIIDNIFGVGIILFYFSGFGYLNSEIKFFFNLPEKKTAEDYFKKYIYLSQVLQSICISAKSEYYRREMSNPNAYTMGALYWQLNDIWAGVTWASVDYYGRWKLLHYGVKRFFSTVLVSPYDDGNNNMIVYVVSDRIEKSKSNLTIETWDWSGKILNTKSVLIDNPIHNSTEVFKQSFDDLLLGKSKSDVFVTFTLIDINTKEELSNNWFYPNQNYGGFKSIKLNKPTITISNVLKDGNYIFFYI